MVRSREEGEEGRGECVVTLQWDSVKSREKGGEGRGECVVTLQWDSVKSREEGEEGRGECVVGALERARAVILFYMAGR